MLVVGGGESEQLVHACSAFDAAVSSVYVTSACFARYTTSSRPASPHTHRKSLLKFAPWRFACRCLRQNIPVPSPEVQAPTTTNTTIYKSSFRPPAIDNPPIALHHALRQSNRSQRPARRPADTTVRPTHDAAQLCCPSTAAERQASGRAVRSRWDLRQCLGMSDILSGAERSITLCAFPPAPEYRRWVSMGSRSTSSH